MTDLLSKLVALSFFFSCVGLSGCSSKSVRSAEELERGVFALSEAKSDHGFLLSKQSVSYQRYIIDRLKQAAETPLPFQVNVVRTNEPFAYHGGGGEIFVSGRLLLRLQNEAEFAFILAHEMAHDILEHEPSKDRSTNLEMEKEADAYAIGLIALAGYDPRVAFSGILNAYRHRDTNSTSHPDLDTRLRHLREYFVKSRWKPPGALNARNYRKYQKYLISSIQG